MTEVLCIETHPENVVVAGYFYPIINEDSPCDCDTIDVGVRNHFRSLYIICTACKKRYPFTTIHWLRRSRFVGIGSKDESETYEKQEELLKV